MNLGRQAQDSESLYLKIICFLLPCLTLHLFCLLLFYCFALQVFEQLEGLFFMRKALLS